MRSIFTALGLLLVSASTFAGELPFAVPEPGTWSLVGLAAAVGWFVTRGKRK